MEKQELKNVTQRFLAEGIAGLTPELNALAAEGKELLYILEPVRQEVAATRSSNPWLDRMQEIYEACVAEALAVANGNEKTLHYANVTSYNLAANLADCWTDATESRTSEHFNAGVVAANRCIELRRRLNKPPAAMAMAYFILGVHEYALHNYANAEDAWALKLENELLELQDPSLAEKELDVLLSKGLIGLARWSLELEDLSRYEGSLQQLDAQRNSDNDGEVQLFVDELKLLKRKHGPA